MEKVLSYSIMEIATKGCTPMVSPKEEAHMPGVMALFTKASSKMD